MKAASVATVWVKKVNGSGERETEDLLAVEAPLELSLAYGPANNRQRRSLSVTMRTPGHDTELATGFFFTEGILSDAAQIESVSQPLQDPNAVTLSLVPGVQPRLDQLERHFYTTSSCGVCGKSSIDAVQTVSAYRHLPGNLHLGQELLHALPRELRRQQAVFEQTGGLHAAALFDQEGRLLLLREDVGRHNALDKLIGAALCQGLLPLQEHILLLSGRASFELIQKAAMAGIRVVAAVGAPSSLAVSLAEDHHMTLIGFLREERFNIYCGPQRITTS